MRAEQGRRAAVTDQVTLDGQARMSSSHALHRAVERLTVDAHPAAVREIEIHGLSPRTHRKPESGFLVPRDGLDGERRAVLGKRRARKEQQQSSKTCIGERS